MTSSADEERIAAICHSLTGRVLRGARVAGAEVVVGSLASLAAAVCRAHGITRASFLARCARGYDAMFEGEPS